MVRYQEIVGGKVFEFDASKAKEIGDAVLEVECAWFKPGPMTMDMGSIGGETTVDAEEDSEDSELKLNLIEGNDLRRMMTDKRSYGSNLTSYMKDVKRCLGDSPGEIEAFEKGLLAYSKDHIFPNFDKFEFYYCPAELNHDLLIPLGYRNDDSKTPYIVLWKHGLKKVEA